MLLERTLQQANNRDDFTDAIRLFYDKASVAEYNFQKLHSLHTPVARLNAIHSDNAVSSVNPDDAGGLHIIFLATQARVMLKKLVFVMVLQVQFTSYSTRLTTKNRLAHCCTGGL